MKKITLILLTISFCGLTACKTGTTKGGDMDKETLVKIEKTAGDIKVKLYNETPKPVSYTHLDVYKRQHKMKIPQILTLIQSCLVYKRSSFRCN